MKRFYKQASVAPAEGDFAVRLDDKPLRTPAGKTLAVPQQALAEAIAAEWQVQGEKIDPLSMPFMQLAATVLDHLPEKRPAMTERMLGYVETDLLCLRSENPPELVALQQREWEQPLDWLKKTHGIALKTTSGLKGAEQPPETRAAFADMTARLDDWAFMGLHEAVGTSGSLVLGMGLQQAAFSPAQVFEWSELESLFQIKAWGLDPVTERKHAAIRGELEMLARWFDLIRL